MLLKFLLFTGFFVGVYILFFKKKKVVTSQNNREDSLEEAMVQCTECGTYVQVKESFLRNGSYYCSNECLEKHS